MISKQTNNPLEMCTSIYDKLNTAAAQKLRFEWKMMKAVTKFRFRWHATAFEQKKKLIEKHSSIVWRPKIIDCKRLKSIENVWKRLFFFSQGATFQNQKKILFFQFRHVFNLPYCCALRTILNNSCDFIKLMEKVFLH